MVNQVEHARRRVFNERRIGVLRQISLLLTATLPLVIIVACGGDAQFVSFDDINDEFGTLPVS